MFKRKQKMITKKTESDRVNKISTLRDILLFSLATLVIIAFSFILGVNPIAVILLLVLFYYLRLQRRLLTKKKYNLLHITFLFVIFLVISDTLLKANKKPDFYMFYIPFSIIPMLATILFSNLEIPLLISLSSAITLTFLHKNDLYLGMIGLISGVVSSFMVVGARRRSQIIRAGFFIGLLQIICFIFIKEFKVQQLTPAYYILFLNGFLSGIIVVGVLSVFEYLFNVVTNISLLELSDFNHPLLKQMILKAPGTYHHSLIVGNLAEQACEAVPGANSLLARVGAYYHDVGKIEKAEYFSENQSPAFTSAHDDLAPTMSKLVITNHVKEGVDLAKKYKLNNKIIDFIQYHHGTSLVYYFYRRALENIEEEKQIEEISKEGFRYPGPKPNTKETAIVLLADSVEAACRSIKEPTHPKIAEVVHKIINNKFIDGQLDDCDLTLGDLEKISSVFIKVLDSMYHTRVTYPEPENKSEANSQKSPKENSHQSKENKKVNP